MTMIEDNSMEADGDQFADMRSSKSWLDMIEDGNKHFEFYNQKCDSIDKLYGTLKSLSGERAEREMQIFWANMEVLKPAIYARPPVPVVTARFKDRKPILGHASELLERAMVASFDAQGLDQTMLMVRDDLATNGRGVVWLRYQRDESGERVVYDHIDRADFVHQPVRKWSEVSWVARRTFKSREEMRKRFEQDSGDAWLKAQYAEIKDEGSGDCFDDEKKAEVWEIWHKGKGVVVWVTKGVEDVLDIREPFLTLDGFFPCPRPAYGTVERRTLRPVPDFLYYRDQIEEINELTARISALSEALRLKGFYAAGNEDVGTAVETAMKQNDNNALLIPVPSVAALGGPGMSDAIVWMPVEQVASTVTSLVMLRRQVIEDVYQVTGLSDIMRGATDPNETLGAQQLKSQYGSVRIRDRQNELVRLARDVCRIAGEIVAENFDPETLLAMSQYDELPTAQDIQSQIAQIDQQIASASMNPAMVEQARANPQMAQQMLSQANEQKQTLANTITIDAVVQFLRDQRMRPFALDIETDSTIQPDENAQKQRVTEFMTALGSTLAQLSPMVQAQPQSAEFAGEVLKFAVAPFRAGRSLDQAIDSFVDQMKQMASQPKPDPMAEKAKAEAEARQSELQMKQQDMQATQAIAGQKAELEMQKMQAEISKINAEIMRIQAQTIQPAIR